MNKTDNNKTVDEKRIDFAIPVTPEMVGIVRLTVSGIASRMGFSIDRVEDIKVAVGEVCNNIADKYSVINDRCIFTFIIKESSLEIIVSFENEKPENFQLFGKEDVFGLLIINSLVDKLCIDKSDKNNTIINMIVLLKES